MKHRKIITYVIMACFLILPVWVLITIALRQPPEEVIAEPAITFETPGAPELTPPADFSDDGYDEVDIIIDDGDAADAVDVVQSLSVVNINTADEELTAVLDALAASYYCVSASITSYSPESGFFTYQYGMADIGDRIPVQEDTLFRVASLSKLVVAILAMDLADEGKLDLDEDISAYLGYSVRSPNHPDVPITCRMLMQHTAGLSDWGPYDAGGVSFSDGTLRRLLDDKASHTGVMPGRRSEYSNLGYVALAAVCEKVSGQMLDALAQEVLFTPMEITAAFSPYYLYNEQIAAQYDIDRNLRISSNVAASTANPAERGFQYNSAPGNLRISALDYARILHMLVNDGVWNGIRILSTEAVQEIHEITVDTETYSLGLCVRYKDDAILGDSAYWHTGSAYGTFAQFLYCKDTGRIVVVVTIGGSGARIDDNAAGLLKSCTALSEPLWGTSLIVRAPDS